MSEFCHFDGSTREESLKKYAQWVENVREPAEEKSEGLRRLTARNNKASAEYEIAPLTSDRWAIRVRCSYSVGDMSGRGCPWGELPTREACVEYFVFTCRNFFEETKDGIQESTRKQMLSLLNDSGLFGFVEPPLVSDDEV